MQNFQRGDRPKNVGRAERAASLMAGALLLSRGLQKKSWIGTGAALLGIAFLRHGVTGFCYTYQALGIDTNEPSPGPSPGHNVSVPSGKGIRVDEAVTINRPRDEVYRFWRDLSNLAHFMEHVESVNASVGSNRSHWIAKSPRGKRMEWDAGNRYAMSPKMNSSHGGHLTDRRCRTPVLCILKMHRVDAAPKSKSNFSTSPPEEPWALSSLRRLFNEDPAQQIHNDLRRLKARLETGVVPETEGQPVGGWREAREPHSDAVAHASEQSFPASDAPAFTHGD